jgi:hypothetical protein
MSLQADKPSPGANVMILKNIQRKQCFYIFRHFDSKYAKNDHNIGFQEKRQIWKIAEIVIITSTPGIDFMNLEPILRSRVTTPAL